MNSQPFRVVFVEDNDSDVNLTIDVLKATQSFEAVLVRHYRSLNEETVRRADLVVLDRSVDDNTQQYAEKIRELRSGNVPFLVFSVTPPSEKVSDKPWSVRQQALMNGAMEYIWKRAETARDYVDPDESQLDLAESVLRYYWSVRGNVKQK